MVTTPIADPILEAAAPLIDADGGEVRIPAPCPITDEYLEELGRRYELLRFEASMEGDLIISGSASGQTRHYNRILHAQVLLWAEIIRRIGYVFGMDAGFHPPGWEQRVPDICWISPETDARVPEINGKRPAYWPVSPEFVIETRSPNDPLRIQREKIRGWADSGTKLALLVDPRNRTIHLCRPHREPEILERPATVSCEPEMPGLTLDLAPLWDLADKSEPAPRG